MSTYKIKGDGNIIGNDNISVFHKSSTIEKELVEIIKNNAKSSEEREKLLVDLATLKNEHASSKEKGVSGAALRQFLLTYGGVAGAEVLAKLVELGMVWAAA